MGESRWPNISVTSLSDKPGACKDRYKYRVNKCIQTVTLEKCLLRHQHLVFLIEEAKILWTAGLQRRKKTSAWSSWQWRKAISISISQLLWRAEKSSTFQLLNQHRQWEPAACLRLKSQHCARVKIQYFSPLSFCPWPDSVLLSPSKGWASLQWALMLRSELA